MGVGRGKFDSYIPIDIASPRTNNKVEYSNLYKASHRVSWMLHHSSDANTKQKIYRSKIKLEFKF